MGRPSNIVVLNKAYQELAGDYYNYQLQLGFGSEGCKSRFNYFKEFLSWLETKGTIAIEEVTPLQLMEYYTYICQRPNRNQSGTLNLKSTHAHMRVIREVFSMLQEKAKVTVNPCSTLAFAYPAASEERTIVSIEEIHEMYQVTESAQERAILSLAYGCGMRASEMVHCNIEDVRLREKILIVPKGKGNKRRVIPLSKKIIEDLTDYYFNEREELTHGRYYKKDEPAFMLNIHGSRMRKYTYNKYLKRIIERTENTALIEKDITPHNLRHSIATHLIEKGLTLQQVRLFLGHNQLETTQLYTRIHIHQIKNMKR